MAKGYLIALVNITDKQAYARYAQSSSKLLREWGARAVVKPDTAIVKEGHPKPRTVIFEFDSFDQAKAFWDSPAYTESKALRDGAADADFILMEGVD